MEVRLRKATTPALALGLSVFVIGGVAAAPARKKAPAKPVAKAAARPAAPAGKLVKLTVKPEKVTLSGSGVSQQFLVFGEYADGRTRDVTSAAKVTAAGGSVKVAGNRVSAAANGTSKVTAALGGISGAMTVTTQGVNTPADWSFANEIVPVFTKAGCNTGGCHGSPSGRGGFRLSLFGYEPVYDYQMLVLDRSGSRISKNQPSQSLILKKATMQVPHGGGMRFKEGSEFYNRILQWLKDGMPAPADPDLRKVLPAETRQTEFEPRLSHIEIYPSEWQLDKAKETQQVVVMAVRDDGTTQDVTQYARYSSNDDQVAEVDDDGLITAVKAGETSIMIRYLGGVGVVNLRVPRPAVPAAEFANFKPNNYIDELVLEKLKEVRIPPSDEASDEVFLRRAFIDTAGVVPTVEEAKAFLDDKSPNKREKLVDSLLSRPEFVDYWTLKWSDLLRNNQQTKQDKGLQVYYRWIKDSIKQNKPYDQFARELITASGSGFQVGPANWYSIGDLGAEYPLFVASATSQVFLGVRLDCARCHNHPFEAWSQMDYYGFAAFFARTKVKNGPGDQERIFYAASEGEVKHPRRTTIDVQSKFLGGDVATFTADEDRREKLANWIVSPANPWFKRSIANRLWNNFFGRGLVNPVDDYRLTNPAANEKLLDAMGEKVVAYKFNLKLLMRDILLSRTYQTSPVPKKLNTDDRVYASHALPRKLFAEVLLDAVDYGTGNRAYYGQGAERAVVIADNRRDVDGGFLTLFGRAKREQACECERSEETNVTMVLNLLNGSTVNDRIGKQGGRVDLAIKAKKPVPELVEEFYLAVLSRRPTQPELAAAQKLISAAPSPREGAEDLMWGLLNTKEFMFNH
ncbi:MAG: DUF1549 domain-containing protein [Actinomycetota bacterium]